MRTGAYLTVAALALGSIPLVATPSSAAVPAFPDNLVVFPDRDFVTVEGYQGHVGETATLEIVRNGQVVGSAQSVVAAGDVAFEVNHPGGVCWGAGTPQKVTPDIRGGDVARIKFDGAIFGDTKVLDTYATGVNYTGGTTFTVSGHAGADVVRSQMEQRIVNPDLTDTAVGRRDIRAVPGGLTRAPKGGYSSNLEFAGDTFTATYVFDDEAVARTAATGGGTRAMAWQEEDADANRQGLTIAEMEELGGPGMGGCPAGPADQAAPAGSFSAVRSADKATLQVNWTPAEPPPGAPAVTGYSIEAIAPANATGEAKTVGARTAAGATRTTIAVEPALDYRVEVRSVAGPRMSEAFTPVSSPPATPPADQTVPGVTASPAPGATLGDVVEATSVTLRSEATADIYYTTDGKAAATGDLPSDSAKLYTGPIPITAQTELHWVAFDRAGNFTDGSGTYAPSTAPLPVPAQLAAPTGTAGQAQVTLRWKPAPEASVTGYGIRVFADGAEVPSAFQETDAATLTATVTGLTPGKPHTFTVAAKNATGYGTPSPQSAALTPTQVTDRVTITSARWKAGDFRVIGTGSSVGAFVTVHRVNADNSIGAAISGAATNVTAPVAPATVGDYSLRLRNGNAPAANPRLIYVKSNLGGIAGPFTVTNG